MSSGARRAIWKGSIYLGLVNIPVKLYPMIREREVKFRLLHRSDKSPIGYKKICKLCGKELSPSEIVMGYEISRGEYVIFEKEEIDALKPESSRKITLNKFVDLAAVDPIYFKNPYLLAPDQNPEPYSLLLHTLQRTGKAGFGKLTLHSREHPVIVYPHWGALIAVTLHYPEEVVHPEAIEELQSLKMPSEEEIELATTIVDTLSGRFEPSEIKDSYREKLLERIQKKLAGEEITAREEKPEEAKSLMEALKKTVEELKAEK